MKCYLSMIKTDIRHFVATQGCDTLLEPQEAGSDVSWRLSYSCGSRGRPRRSDSLRQSGPRPLILGLWVSTATLVGSAERAIREFVDNSCHKCGGEFCEVLPPASPSSGY